MLICDVVAGSPSVEDRKQWLRKVNTFILFSCLRIHSHSAALLVPLKIEDKS